MQRLEIDLKNLITQAKFGSAMIGMTIEEVKKHLGEPTSIGDSSSSGFIDFFYGCYEIFFYNYWDESGIYKVAAFQNDSLQYLNGFEFENDTFKIKPWILEHGLTFDASRN